jgi:phytoene/squalene synthetase
VALSSSLRDALIYRDAQSLAVDSDQDAYRLCRTVAFGHYENFPVAQLALGSVRDDIAAIYAFARLADDIADELPVPVDQKLSILDTLTQWLEQPPSEHPVFRALWRTIERNRLPLEPFHRLLTAFRFDAARSPFVTEDSILAYCRNSAAPIGELLLRLAGEWNERTSVHSDAFCSGLQVLNFWQDIAHDLRRGRSTIPQEWLGDTAASWETLIASPQLLQLVVTRYDRLVARLLTAGLTLSSHLRSVRLVLQVRTTWAAASCVWRACQRRGIRIEHRPRLRWWHAPSLVWGVIAARPSS